MRVISLISALIVVVAIGCSSAPAVSPGASGVAGVPLATIDSPASGANIAVGQALQVSARGDDTTGVTRLDLRVGDVLVDSATTPGDTAQRTFSALLEWTPSAEGTVTISVLAYRENGTGSLPASIQVVVGTGTAVGSPSSGPGTSPGLTATPTVGPGATSAPSDDPSTPRPTRAPRPTVPPAPTARPTIRADLEVYMQDEDVPTTWMAGVPVQFDVYIRNNDRDKAAPENSTIEVFAAGRTVTRGIRKKRIGPEGVEHYTVTVTPKRDGERALRITILLPRGYEDRTPGNNVFKRTITVLPAVIPSPSAGASASP